MKSAEGRKSAVDVVFQPVSERNAARASRQSDDVLLTLKKKDVRQMPGLSLEDPAAAAHEAIQPALFRSRDRQTEWIAILDQPRYWGIGGPEARRKQMAPVVSHALPR